MYVQDKYREMSSCCSILVVIIVIKVKMCHNIDCENNSKYRMQFSCYYKYLIIISQIFFYLPFFCKPLIKVHYLFISSYFIRSIDGCECYRSNRERGREMGPNQQLWTVHICSSMHSQKTELLATQKSALSDQNSAF